jgi:hypothetical protein
LNQSLSQNNDQNQPNYPSSSLHDPYHGNDFEQSQPTHSKYPPHAGGFDYDPVRRYQTLDGNFPVPLFQNHNTALLVQPTRYEVQHQQPQQNYENGSSQLQDSGTNGSQERSSVKKRTMPNVPPGLPIEDPFIANPELMGAGIYNRGVDVSGFPPPLLPYDKSFLPLPAGSAGTHHGRALDMGFSNRYHPYPLGTHRNYGGGMMGREANGYLPPPRGAGYPVNMNGCDKKEGKNGNKYHPPLQEARPSHGLDPKGYGNGGMNQDGYYPHPQGAFPNHGVGPNGYDIEGMNQNGYYAHRPVVHPSYGVGPIGYDHGGTNYIGFYPHPPDAPGPAFHEGMGNMALSDSLQPRANSNLGGDGGAEQYGNHQMSNNIVVGLRHQESRALLYDPEVPLPSIETDEYQEWANLRQQLRDPYGEFHSDLTHGLLQPPVRTKGGL